MNMDSMHLHINFFNEEKIQWEYDVITLIPRRTFWKDFDDQNFLCTLNYGFFLLSPLINESNSFKAHLSNLSFP
jgi:hypothetical protein